MSELMTITMCDVENVALNEIKQGASRKAVALTLAFGVRQGDQLDWAKINKAILDRWSPSGREFILTRMWNLVEGRIQP